MGRCDSRIADQAVTYLLHLLQRRLVHAELLKVILRGLNHLVNDLLVHSALGVAVSALAFYLVRRRLRSAPGQLTTIVFDMAASLRLFQLSIVCLATRAGTAQRLCDCRVRAEDGYRRQD